MSGSSYWNNKLLEHRDDVCFSPKPKIRAQLAVNPEPVNVHELLTRAGPGSKHLNCDISFLHKCYLTLPLISREYYSMILILQMRKLRC